MQLVKGHKHTWERAEVGAHYTFECFCGASTKACKECGSPLDRAPDLDRAFAQVWVGYRCNKGHEEREQLA